MQNCYSSAPSCKFQVTEISDLGLRKHVILIHLNLSWCSGDTGSMKKGSEWSSMMPVMISTVAPCSCCRLCTNAHCCRISCSHLSCTTTWNATGTSATDSTNTVPRPPRTPLIVAPSLLCTDVTMPLVNHGIQGSWRWTCNRSQPSTLSFHHCYLDLNLLIADPTFILLINIDKS